MMGRRWSDELVLDIVSAVICRIKLHKTKVNFSQRKWHSYSILKLLPVAHLNEVDGRERMDVARSW
jgi:hypothetical protein